MLKLTPTKFLRVFLGLLLVAVVVFVPRDVSFLVMILLILAVAFGGGFLAGEIWAAPLVPVAMFIAGQIEVLVRDYPKTEDEIPQLFEVGFYIFGFVVLTILAAGGVFMERYLRRLRARSLQA